MICAFENCQGARLLKLPGCEKASGYPLERHREWRALRYIEDCPDCLAIVVAAVRVATLEEAARVCETLPAQAWWSDNYTDARRDAANAVRALTGSQTPNG